MSDAESSGILNRSMKPNLTKTRDLQKRLMTMSKQIHIEIKEEVNEQYDIIYSAENKAKAQKKEAHHHRVSLRENRNKTSIIKNKRLSVRSERMSVVDSQQAVEKNRLQGMSLDEKAALKRKQRKTLKEQTGGKSEFIAIQEEDEGNSDGEEDLNDHQRKFRKSMKGNNFDHLISPDQQQVSRFTISPQKSPLKKKAFNPKMSPLTALLSSGGRASSYQSVDDITLFCFDDLLMNEKMRHKPVPIINFDNPPRPTKSEKGKKLFSGEGSE